MYRLLLLLVLVACKTQPPCTATQKLCGRSCVDVTIDVNNCGLCANTCYAGFVCGAGTCTCPSAQTNCGGSCIDTRIDTTNCGACGHSCAPDAICQNGTCVGPTTCPNVPCAPHLTCVAGLCTCPGGQTDCGSTCSDLNEESHCGDCAAQCSQSAVCARTGVVGCLSDLPAPALPGFETYGMHGPTGATTAIPLVTALQESAAVYECRIGTPLVFATFGASDAWLPCDGGDGHSPSFALNSAGGDGTKRMQVRVRFKGKVATSQPQDAYLHHDLDNLTRCDAPFLDNEVAFATARGAINTAIGSTGLLSAFAAVDLTRPKLVIPFVQVRASDMMRYDLYYRAGAGGATGANQPSVAHGRMSAAQAANYSMVASPAADYPTDIIGATDPDWQKFDITLDSTKRIAKGGSWAPLRHRFVKSEGNDLIMFYREWPRPKPGLVNACMSTVRMAPNINRGGWYADSILQCAAFAVARNGYGVCLNASGSVVATSPYGWAKLISFQSFSGKCFSGETCDDAPGGTGYVEYPKLYLPD